jgi:D-xylose 1-dehydrogenase (NADP+, D-xylono-1,5-lactone-forming)
MTKLRWGILGVAGINNRILPSFLRARNVELKAIASRSLDKAKAAAKAASIPVAHGSYEALLDDATIDAVYIPLPNSLHHEWTRKAAERGKHVWCEKPLCPSADEGRALIDFCKAKGVKLMDGFMWPHHPRTEHLRQFLDSGGIGEVRRVGGTFTFQMRPLDPNNTRLKPELAGGSLLDVGCYPVYGIRWAFGAEPIKAFATATFHNGVDIEMNGILWFADGRTATFDGGFTHPFRRWLEITGTDAVVWVPQMWIPLPRANYYIYREGKPVEEVVIENEDQIQHMIENFNRAVLENQPVTPPPEEAVKTLRVLDALSKSAREGRVVAVE